MGSVLLIMFVSYVVVLCIACRIPVSCLSYPCVLFVVSLCLVCRIPVSYLSYPCVLFVVSLCLICRIPVSCLSYPCVLFVVSLCLVCRIPVPGLSYPCVLCAQCCQCLCVVYSEFPIGFLGRLFWTFEVQVNQSFLMGLILYFTHLFLIERECKLSNCSVVSWQWWGW
jgi:hypothetical protein